MNKLLAAFGALILSTGIMFGCAANNNDTKDDATTTTTEQTTTQATSDEAATETQYITAEDLKSRVDAADTDILLVDVRKLADYDEGHIDGAITADMDAAKDGNMEDGEITMKEALAEATGSDTGADRELILICYSGNAYAKAATDVLSSIGAKMENVYTLEGGMKAWNEAYPDELVTTP